MKKSGISLRRIAAMMRKEIFHVARDPFTLALAMGLPIIMVTFFGLAIEFNMRDVRISVYDGDHGVRSRQLQDAFRASGYFITSSSASVPEALEALQGERSKGALIIERGFQKDLGGGLAGRVQMLIDGADNSTVGVILSYVSGIQRKVLAGWMADAPSVGAPTLDMQTRFLFNPELSSQWFMVPGLIVVVSAVLSILLTALTVAREWENGSMELLLSTPVHPLEIVIGKITPYVFLAFLGIVLVYLAARLGFGVPFLGSHLVLGVGSLIFVSTYLAQGMLISVLTRKQAIAMQISLVSGLLPSLLLSGFIFPIESMPAFFQYFSSIFPARWFMVITRNSFLKGGGFEEMVVPFLALITLNLLLVAAATKRFKRDLEP